jgi:plasmid stability protein
MARTTRDDSQTRVRLPENIKKQLKIKAVENNRSLNAEIAFRLEQSLKAEQKEKP